MTNTPRLGFGPGTAPVGTEFRDEQHVRDAARELFSGGALLIQDRDLTAPPGSPVDATAYIVHATATGAWAGHNGEVAYWLDDAGAWQFASPWEGLQIRVVDEAANFQWNGSSFTSFGTGAGSAGSLSAGTSSMSLGAVVLSNSNGLSFGLSNGTLTGAYSQSSNLAALIIGAATLAAGSAVLSNSNNVTFGLAGSTITASASMSQSTAPAALYDGANSISSGTVRLSNSNGVTFGFNGQTVTASVRTDYQSSGAYLTTAMQSNAATISNAKFSAGTLSALRSDMTLADSNGVSFGLNTNGVLTASVGAGAAAGSVSAGTASMALGQVVFSNASGVSWGLNGSTLTASVKTDYQTSGAYLTTAQPVGAYLTTARASNDAVGLNTAKTNATWTVNSSGISLDAGGYAGSGMTTATTTGVAIVGTHNSAGLSLGVPAMLTTAMASNRGSDFIAASASFNGTNISATLASGAVSFSVGNYLTTARASTDAIGLATAQSNVTWTANSAGLSFDARGYAGTGTSATNASVTLNSAGLAISVAAPGAGGGIALYDGANSITSGTARFSNSNNVSFGFNGSTITASISNDATHTGFNPYANAYTIINAGANGSISICPVNALAFQCDRAIMAAHNTNSSNSSGQHSLTYAVGIYSRNASTLSLVTSGSISIALTHSGTDGSYSLYSGIRMVTMPLTATVSEGLYWIAALTRSSSGVTGGSYSHMAMSQVNSNMVGHFGSSNASTMQFPLGHGIYTATSAAMPNSMAFSDIRGSVNDVFRNPIVIFQSGTV